MKQSDLCSPSVSVGACEFTACVSVNFMHRHRSARRVVTLLASELKTANDKSWNNRKIIQIWLVSRVLHKQQKFFPAPPACFFPANMESICPSVSMPCSCPGSYAHTRTNIHTDTHTHETCSEWNESRHRVSPSLWHWNLLIYCQELILKTATFNC